MEKLFSRVKKAVVFLVLLTIVVVVYGAFNVFCWSVNPVFGVAASFFTICVFVIVHLKVKHPEDFS